MKKYKNINLRKHMIFFLKNKKIYIFPLQQNQFFRTIIFWRLNKLLIFFVSLF